MLKELPLYTLANKAKVHPMRDVPRLDKDAPKRLKLRRANELPTFMNEKIEMDAPKRAMPRRESDEPRRPPARIAIDDPRIL